ncbi:DegT/DnrJ/EryC1/StrS family aminotransferase [Streptomyces sp. NPDC056161]|uniref:DegT/DnrJ/EryC1/StrS family aminotransferase n=1 Tax=Streptomyces sp. NPDC056161 TaxID=3345732 RepID=UPI0035D8D884
MNSVTADSTPACSGGRPVRPEPVACTVPADDVVRAEVEELMANGLLSDWYGGPQSHRFEEAFAAYHGPGTHAVAVNSGTSALHLSLAAAGVGPGTEVIVPALCYVAAAAAVVQLGGIPVICDVEPDSLTLDTARAEALVSSRTRAILPVHFWGYPADLVTLREVCERHGLALVEDAAQAPGATVGDRKVGTFGEFATYSLGVRKHVACGEGGVVLARTASQADRIRSLCNSGKGPGWDDYLTLGYNYRMVEFSAIVARRGLERLDDEIAARRYAAELYREGLKSTDLTPVAEPRWGRCVYFKLPILLPEEGAERRQAVVDGINAENVSCRIPHRPLYSIPWLRDYTKEHGVYPGDGMWPVAQAAHARLIEVETGPNLPAHEAAKSVHAVHRVWNSFTD